uniref:Enoyl reductase (ER) domain-containing protein n=1 Tax=Rodentolepis nana TaxID=102285 RepID=A0A158QJ86_RODNA
LRFEISLNFVDLSSGVGFQDLMTRQGLLEFLGKPPFVMGSECCGKVIEVGEDVTKFKVGDEVIVLVDSGAWTEHLVVKPIPEEPTEADGDQAENASNGVPLALVLHKPDSLSTNQAASFLMSYLPAYLLLHNVACVHSGDVVLVHSAGGGILCGYVCSWHVFDFLSSYVCFLIASSGGMGVEVA